MALGPDRERYLNTIECMSFLDNFEVLFFFVRCFIDVLDQEKQPKSGKRTESGPGALGRTEDVWRQTYENKKEGLQNYLEYSNHSREF